MKAAKPSSGTKGTNGKGMEGAGREAYEVGDRNRA